MNDQPLVSILVNCYNSEAYLKQALDSIYAQTYQNFEIILVDNCSTDRTAEIAYSYDQRLVYIKTEKTIPLYGARNVGLPKVRGEYLCILDSDDFWMPDKLIDQVKIMQQNSEIGTLYSKYSSLLEAPQGLLYQFKMAYLKLINFSDNFLCNQFVSHADLIKRYNINFQTIMFRTSVLKDMQFDSKLNLIGDLDFIYRLVWEKGCKIFYMNQKTAISRIHQRQLSRKSDLRWVVESLKVYKKMQLLMSENEKKMYFKFFVEFYFSSHLLRHKKMLKSLCLKSQYVFTSLRYFIHFNKSLVMALKG